MGKLKTHKGLKKAINKRQSGSITIGHQGGRHNTGSKNAKANRRYRSKSELSTADQSRLKHLI